MMVGGPIPPEPEMTTVPLNVDLSSPTHAGSGVEGTSQAAALAASSHGRKIANRPATIAEQTSRIASPYSP